MRVLCLHDQLSSGSDLSNTLHKLVQKLQTRHGIELTFVNSPLVVNQRDEDTKDPITRSDERIWFDENKVGLDASILNLRQIWSHSLHSNPFSGILGIGQGAAIAAIIPHLRFQSILDEEGTGTAMFEGLRFCTFIHGWDILASADSPNECYDDVENISTLHITTESDMRSKLLFYRYGGKKDDSSAQDYQIQDESSRNICSNDTDVRMLNEVGKYFVAQKKKFLLEQRSNSAQYQQLRQAQNNATTTNPDANIHESLGDGVGSDELGVVLDAETTRMKIVQLENKAISLLNASIAHNPPKALMAVITPNDDKGNKFVGGWAGPKDAFRSSGFKESGGAPCPKDFILPIEERMSKAGEKN